MPSRPVERKTFPEFPAPGHSEVAVAVAVGGGGGGVRRRVFIESELKKNNLIYNTPVKIQLVGPTLILVCFKS